MFDMFRGNDHGIGSLEGGEPQSSVTWASSPGLRVKVASTGFYAPPGSRPRPSSPLESGRARSGS